MLEKCWRLYLAIGLRPRIAPWRFPLAKASESITLSDNPLSPLFTKQTSSESHSVVSFTTGQKQFKPYYCTNCWQKKKSFIGTPLIPLNPLVFSVSLKMQRQQHFNMNSPPEKVVFIPSKPDDDDTHAFCTDRQKFSVWATTLWNQIKKTIFPSRRLSQAV